MPLCRKSGMSMTGGASMFFEKPIVSDITYFASYTPGCEMAYFDSAHKF